MTQRMTIYGYAYTSHGYSGTTGAYKVDTSVDIPDDVDPSDYVAMIESFLEDNRVKVYNKDNENKGHLSYGIEQLKGEMLEPPTPEDTAERMMETAEKVKIEIEDIEEGEVERNATEHRDEEGEYYGEQ